MFTNIQAIILAAGKSQRFKTNKTKMTEPICGQPMILYQTTLLESLGVPMTIAVGHQKELLQKTINQLHANINFSEQKEQKGTGDAVACTREYWTHDYILIMNGDVPLITEDIIKELCSTHMQTGAAITFVTSHDDTPANGYGKVIKKDGHVEIVETKNLPDSLQEQCCINAGIYMVNKDFLTRYIDQLTHNALTGEYYVTDLIKMASDHGFGVETITVPFDKVRGINTLEELWAAEQVKRSQLIKYWMQNGVRFSIAQNVHIDLGVTIEPGSFIGSAVQLTGATKIGANVIINSFSLLHNAIVENGVTIKAHSVIEDSHISADAQVGPFAYLRNNNQIGDDARIGAFVELKNSKVGKGSRIKHLSYIGDAQIGAEVNVGGGTVTANHNGVSKNKTTIKDNAYIGANNSLVAPVVIGKDAYTAAGSTITQEVPANALAIARARQVNKKEYAEKIKEKLQQAELEKKKKANKSFVPATELEIT